PAEEQAKRNAYCGGKKECDRDAARADPDMEVIFLHKNRQTVSRIFAEPFANDRRQAWHFGKTRQLPNFDGQIPEAEEQREPDKHQIWPRALQPKRRPMERQCESGDVPSVSPRAEAMPREGLNSVWLIT